MGLVPMERTTRINRVDSMTSNLERQFADLWLALYPTIDLYSEYRFSPPRRYRWDFCHPESKVAIEIQGGVWMRKSGHSGERLAGIFAS